MTWWTWILLWLALIALSLLFLGFLAWRLFRGFSALADEMGRAGELLAPSAAGPEEVPVRTFHPAAFRSLAAVRAENLESARLRRWQRAERRIRRRSLRNQPQLLRDMPHL